MAVRSITGSLGHGPNSTVQNFDRRDFIVTSENTPLKSASNGLYLNIDQDRIDETSVIVNFEDGDFPALKPNHDRQAHARHRYLPLWDYLLKRRNCRVFDRTSLY